MKTMIFQGPYVIVYGTLLEIVPILYFSRLIYSLYIKCFVCVYVTGTSINSANTQKQQSIRLIVIFFLYGVGVSSHTLHFGVKVGFGYLREVVSSPLPKEWIDRVVLLEELNRCILVKRIKLNFKLTIILQNRLKLRTGCQAGIFCFLEMLILSRFWRPEIGNQCVSRSMKALGKSHSLTFPSFQWLRAILDISYLLDV